MPQSETAALKNGRASGHELWSSQSREAYPEATTQAYQ